MGSCFSRKETQKTQLETSISQSQTQEIQEEYNGIVWFDLPYDIRRMIIDSMDLEGKRSFSKCSMGCNKEVALTFQNYIVEILIFDKGIGENRNIGVFVHAIDEQYHYILAKLSYGKDNICRFMNEEISLTTIFDTNDLIEITLRYFNFILKKNTKTLKSIRIELDDFPYNRTNINKLKSLESLILSKNIHGIDPISSGFVDFDTLSQIRNRVEIPNIQLDYLFQLKSEKRYLRNPIFWLTEFDEFLRLLLIEEVIDEHSIKIGVGFDEIDRRSDLIQIIQKYTGTGVEDEEAGEGSIKYVRFWRKSKKWPNRQHRFLLRTTRLIYSQIKQELEF